MHFCHEVYIRYNYFYRKIILRNNPFLIRRAFIELKRQHKAQLASNLPSSIQLDQLLKKQVDLALRRGYSSFFRMHYATILSQLRMPLDPSNPDACLLPQAALHLACARGYVEIAEFLITMHCQKIALMREYHVAVIENHLGTILLLLYTSHLTSLLFSHFFLFTFLFLVLFVSLLLSYTEILRLLIKYYPDQVNCMSASGHESLGPLHVACCFDSLEAARLLIDAGADVRAATSGDDHKGSTPLHLAAYAATQAFSNRTFRLFDLLIRHGASVNARDDHRTPSLLPLSSIHLSSSSFLLTDCFFFLFHNLSLEKNDLLCLACVPAMQIRRETYPMIPDKSAPTY